MTQDPCRTVLFLHPSGNRYGADVALLALIRSLDPARWKAVVALQRGGPLVAELEAAGATVELGPLGVVDRATLRSPWRLARLLVDVPAGVAFVRRLVARHAPALVHTSTTAVLGGALGARLARTRHVWNLREFITRPTWAARLFARSAARLADVVVSNSYATRAAHDAHSSDLAARHRVVHDGVDRGRLAPERYERDQARAALGVPAESPLVVLVGRLHEWRGHRVLIDAAERLRFKHPDAVFLLVGDAPPWRPRAVQDLTDELARRNLEGYVRQVPYLDDLALALVAADVVVVPSTRPEPFPRIVVEAMACARPVVAAAHGGAIEIVENGVTGLCVEPGDVDRLAWALQVLVEDRARAREMGRRGEAAQRARFDASRVAAEMDRVWSHLLEREFRMPADEASIVHVVAAPVGPHVAERDGRAVHRIARAQTEAGLAARVVSLAGAAAAAPTPQLGHAVTTLPHEVLGGRRGALAALVRDLPPTAIVHIHGRINGELLGLSRALARRRLPFVVTPHGAYRKDVLSTLGSFARARALRQARGVLQRAKVVHVESEREGEELAQMLGVRRTALVAEGREAQAAPWGGAREDLRRPLFGCVSPLVAERRGLEHLLDAFARNAAAGHEGTLWLIGDGPGRAALEARAHELGIGRRIAFVDAKEPAELVRRLALCDVVVQPSTWSDGSDVLLEAASLGRPLVVVDGGDVAGDVHASGAGFVVRSADPELLGAALAACERERDDGTLAARGRAGLELMWRRHSPSLAEQQLRHSVYGLGDANAPSAASELRRSA